ncbi:MAG: amidohydrolase family protein, partial [Gemmatimonadales bacterium]
MRRLLLLALLAGCGTAESADLVLTNGVVYTLDSTTPRAEAVAIKGDRILAVGSADEIQAYQGSATRVVDLGGAAVFPGWADAHYHLSGVGDRELTLNLEGTDTKDAFLAKVKERVDRTPAGQWVTGRGWIETFWTPAAFPSRQDLDAIAPDHPVILSR